VIVELGLAIDNCGNRMKYYAHSKEGRPPEEWQELDEHLRNVAERAAMFASVFQSADWAWNAGWLHDIGKSDSAFQGYLRRENGFDDADYDSGRVNHSSAGAALAEGRLGACVGRILAYLVAGHHAGIPDWYPSETANAALSVRLEEGGENLERIQDFAGATIRMLRQTFRPPNFVKRGDFHLWVRMLYSCLVDADYLDTETCMHPAQGEGRGGFKTLSELKPIFDAYMENKSAKADRTPVNAIRQEILEACRSAAQQDPGLYSLTVPTGGGKTLSGMAFALDHAVKHGKRRIIYVIPYTSIIEQTVQIMAGVFGPENVVEHHSNLDPERETQRTRLAAENWDAPIIVTTNVQFFESLYAAKSGRCRKLHNIINSVVILDEAQLLPPELLTPCVDVMNRLVRNYGVTMVLSTATQPALPKIDHSKEIIPVALDLYGRLKRTEFDLPDLNTRTEWGDLAKCLQQHEQVLCVVNTRRDCFDLYKLMPEGTIHLSALMCGEHRSAVIADIKQRLRDGLSIRVVSTQLVEAGVEIDFPVVYRALAGLDSIAQAAGRCNREGRMVKGEVHVFVPPKSAPLGLLRKGEDTTRELCAVQDFNLHQANVFTSYFALFYSRVNDTGSRFNDWLVRDENPHLHFQFRTAGEKFRLIDDQAQRAVFVRFGDSPRWLDQLRVIGPTRENLRRLQRYTVNLSVRTFNQAKTDGLLEEVGKDFWSWIGRYDVVIGLDAFGTGRAPEDLVV
jgi:CRISPR-associated endonuclease/helicase Cas3